MVAAHGKRSRSAASVLPMVVLLLILLPPRTPVHAAGGGRHVAGGGQLPSFEPGPCPFEGGAWLEQERIECGTLVVPESRDRPEGRRLRLAVAVLRSRSDDPRPDPVVFLSGGPGGAAVRFAAGFSRSSLWNLIRQERDVVVWDQRGTGFSEPAFCRDRSAELMATNLGPMTPEERLQEARRLLQECRERVLAEGLDFSAYNSVASAWDLEDLRVALGYERWNLLGGSYGTRLALIAARDLPHGIRAMILDSVSPTDVGGDDFRHDDFARSLELVFRRCEADAACDALFPELEMEFYAAIEELDAEPLVVPMADTARFAEGSITVDGRLFAAGIFQGLYLQDFIPLVPHAIRQIRARNEALVRALAAELAPDPETENPWLQYSVECYEQAPLMSEETAAAVQARHPHLPDLAAPSLAAVCDAWHAERADPAVLLRPITVDIPTLVAAGEFDPITPPSHGRRVAAALPRSQYFEVPGAGHGALIRTPCARRLAVAFLNGPERALDTSCLDELPGLTFVTDLRIVPGVATATTRLAEGPGLGDIVWVASTLLLLASTLIAWPASVLGGRLRGRPADAPGQDGRRLAFPLAFLTALCAVGFVAGLALVVRDVATRNPFILGFGLPGAAAPLLLLPWVTVALATATAVCAVLAWRRRWWGRWARLYLSAVAAAGASFVALLMALRLL
jgi:pimeloyl-ACP methyl ester carboxylesterase